MKTDEHSINYVEKSSFRSDIEQLDFESVETTKIALDNVLRGINLSRSFTSVEDLMKDLKSED